MVLWAQGKIESNQRRNNFGHSWVYSGPRGVAYNHLRGMERFSVVIWVLASIFSQFVQQTNTHAQVACRLLVEESGSQLVLEVVMGEMVAKSAPAVDLAKRFCLVAFEEFQVDV